MATHSSILAFRSPWGCKESDGTEGPSASLFIFDCTESSLLHLGPSLVAASRVYSRLQYAGFSSQWLLSLQSAGSRARGLQ